MSEVHELFGHSTLSVIDWKNVVRAQHCPYLGKMCIKTRKSSPEIAIGTCTVEHGTEEEPVVICPFRLLERKQVFTDCLQLLTKHEPGNELHVIPEVSIPGGNVDYFLVSARGGKVRDFVAIELQTLDTTGTVWPARQRFLKSVGLSVDDRDSESSKPYGMNWKMTAKTILVQMHHKVHTLEHLSKHLVLVIQDRLLDYMRKEFSFAHVKAATIGDSAHFHSYSLVPEGKALRMELALRLSTDADGIGMCLGLQAEAKVELSEIVKLLEAKLSTQTLLTLG